MQRMDRLRRSLRDSFRRKREAPESSKPHQWQADEMDVRNGTCSFPVRYLGCVEVFESRGMQVCEEAMKVLRQSRRRPVKSILFVSGDGLRVVEDDTKGLIVDQTIEKVSFCAPDRNHERGFSYICRDGTTRRWMCHGFLAKSDSGERISHGVGCSFAFCLERKQKREKECGVSMTFDPKTSTFTRSGSFRVNSITDTNSSSSPPPVNVAGDAVRNASAVSTHAIERPHAPPKMLERQGSFRGFTQLANQSPFKRQLSLRLSDLPSNLQRTQNNVDILTNNVVVDPLISTVNATPIPAPRMQRNSLPNNSVGHGVIPETTTVLSRTTPEVFKNPVGSPINHTQGLSLLCQQVTQGLSLLAANHDDLKNESNTSQFPTKFTSNPWDEEVGIAPSTQPPPQPLTAARPPPPPIFSNRNIRSNSISTTTTAAAAAAIGSNSSSRLPKEAGDEWVTGGLSHNLAQNQVPKPSVEKSSNGLISQPPPAALKQLPTTSPRTNTTTTTITSGGSRPAAALPATVVSSSTTSSVVTTTSSGWTGSNVTAATTTTPKMSPARPPLVSTGSIANPTGTRPPGYRGPPSRSHSLGADPFDADWATGVARTNPTNPFARQQTFQVSM